MSSHTQTKQPVIAAIGVFDGVHFGHQKLIEATRTEAKACGARSMVITFERDPDELFNPKKVRKLLANTERLAFLSQQADELLTLPFNRDFAAQTPAEFLASLLVQVPGLKGIHVGTNFNFGARAAGHISDLAAWGKTVGITVNAHTLFIKEGKAVSSTRIRDLLFRGEARQATALLTRPFAPVGTVQSGAGRGADLGFATANVLVDGSYAPLGPFVYAAYAQVQGRRYKAAVSTGEPPTFSPDIQQFNPCFFEAHLLDFEGDLYHQEMRIEFIENLRPMRRFDTQQELIDTVMGNIAWVRTNL